MGNLSETRQSALLEEAQICYKVANALKYKLPSLLDIISIKKKSFKTMSAHVEGANL